MTISLDEFLDRILSPNSDLYLMVCGEVIVYDNGAKTVYSPITTHHNASLNPLVDFRTHIGHSLLWSRHVEIQCTSEELRNALYTAGYEIAPLQSSEAYARYALSKPVRAG
ncbi:hypothetical protein SAMN02745823_00288 [Sporobacter termitidis DSM 10068]|uniref:Uncharacterized protein n=1 Tax=Sporobacter termitidis DSM 10068 TaxID=1123282 RepID=A0A1M5TYU1_9FIRM|nr:hypothetical protein [Sporobacter termitidis]SHH55909.1 hypothetical protein SAMN02745823_00288 [Sporobacter termitidis DSM 10068]